MESIIKTVPCLCCFRAILRAPKFHGGILDNSDVLRISYTYYKVEIITVPAETLNPIMCRSYTTEQF